MLQEKDIPIQVAIGNYDLGICGLDWIEELLAKFPQSPVVKIADLEYDKAYVYLAASSCKTTCNIGEFTKTYDTLRIVTDYPNLAEFAALNLRLKRFSIFPVYGAIEAYPPEDADLVVLRGKNVRDIKDLNLVPLKELFPCSAFLIANRDSVKTKDISPIIDCFRKGMESRSKPWLKMETGTKRYLNNKPGISTKKTIRLAVPDGHQQQPALEFLGESGIKFKDEIKSNTVNRRPALNIPWIDTKVIRPQDMPMQVANGNFDLAITGKDWLLDHLYRFPSSPVTELVTLGFGEVRIVAVVSHTLPVSKIEDLKKLISQGKLTPLRVATEYTNIADKYLRDNHIGWYKIVPTWGATEAFLPEDADLLIENTQTGKTLAMHNLVIIDTLFRSTACLIGNKKSLKSAAKKEKISWIVDLFTKTAENRKTKNENN